jgi:hypothetical protein
MKTVIDCETQQIEIRPLTKDELDQQAKDEAESAKPKVITDPFELARLEAKAVAEAKLAALGLTVADLTALGI